MLLLCSQLRIVNRRFWYWVNCFIRFIGAPWASLPCNFSHPSICGWNSGMSVMRWTRVRKGSYGQQTYLFSVVKSQHILYRSTTWLQDFSWWKLSITVLRGMLCKHQDQGQVITSYSVCACSWSVDACFWHSTPQMADMWRGVHAVTKTVTSLPVSHCVIHHCH